MIYGFLSSWLATHDPDGTPILPRGKLPALAKAAVAACDANDAWSTAWSATSACAASIPPCSLRRAALALSNRSATPADFRSVDRKDEIGDLARTLEELTGRLDAHIRLLESFAGDVSHEFKNPLASIRVAAEVIASTADAAERERLLGLLTRDVDRLERLVTGVRELARIDAQLAHEEITPVDLSGLLAQPFRVSSSASPRCASRTAGHRVVSRCEHPRTASRRSSRTSSTRHELRAKRLGRGRHARG